MPADDRRLLKFKAHVHAGCCVLHYFALGRELEAGGLWRCRCHIQPLRTGSRPVSESRRPACLGTASFFTEIVHALAQKLVAISLFVRGEVVPRSGDTPGTQTRDVFGREKLGREIGRKANPAVDDVQGHKAGALADHTESWEVRSNSGAPELERRGGARVQAISG